MSRQSHVLLKKPFLRPWAVLKHWHDDPGESSRKNGWFSIQWGSNFTFSRPHAGSFFWCSWCWLSHCSNIQTKWSKIGQVGKQLFLRLSDLAFGPHATCFSFFSPAVLSRWWLIMSLELQPLLVFFLADGTCILLLCCYLASAAQVTGTKSMEHLTSSSINVLLWCVWAFSGLQLSFRPPKKKTTPLFSKYSTLAAWINLEITSTSWKEAQKMCRNI